MRSGRRRGRALAVSAVVLSLGAAGACVQLPETRTGTTTAAWSPVTDQAGKAFLRRYDKVHNRASSDRDAKLAASVESGPLLRTSEAEYRVSEGLDPDGETPPKPTVHDDAAIYVPQFDGFPVWFLASSTASGEPSETLDLVLRAGAAMGWKKTISVVLDDQARLPKLASRDGAAVAVTPASAERLLRTPEQAAAAYAKVLGDGAGSPHAAAFAEHPETERSQRASAANHKQTSFFAYKQEFFVIAVRALSTGDGGALTVFSVGEIEDLAVNSGAELTFKKTDPIAAYTGRQTGNTHLRTSWVWQIAAVVPPKDEDGGKIELIGVDRSLASAAMT